MLNLFIVLLFFISNDEAKMDSASEIQDLSTGNFAEEFLGNPVEYSVKHNSGLLILFPNLGNRYSLSVHAPSGHQQFMPHNETKMLIRHANSSHHGNWMFSAVDYAGREKLNQFFTIFVEEQLDTIPYNLTSLPAGTSFEFRLERDFDNLELCEIMKPKRSRNNNIVRLNTPATCAFLVNNISLTDSGTWQIAAVADINYYGSLTLDVLE